MVEDAEICAAIIAMAHNLELAVVAEGVEDDQQLHFLHLQGCNYVQGFYYSPPVPAEKFAVLLKDGLSQKNVTHLKVKN
jgi:EAL domain-containing protein (putative c-di-GMP-specific phosphodiesterase class I)